MPSRSREPLGASLAWGMRTSSMLLEADIANFYSEFEAELDA
jgi:hypothetical protein